MFSDCACNCNIGLSIDIHIYTICILSTPYIAIYSMLSQSISWRIPGLRHMYPIMPSMISAANYRKDSIWHTNTASPLWWQAEGVKLGCNYLQYRQTLKDLEDHVIFNNDIFAPLVERLLMEAEPVCPWGNRLFCLTGSCKSVGTVWSVNWYVDCLRGENQTHMWYRDSKDYIRWVKAL